MYSNPSMFPVRGISGNRKNADSRNLFKVQVMEFRLFLENARARYGDLSFADLRSRPGATSALETEWQDHIRGHFVPTFLRISAHIDSLRRGLRACESEELKEFSQKQLHKLLMQAPVLERALVKPLGYPGDYEVMRYIYERPLAGETWFAKAVNLAATNLPAALAVRTRKDVIRAEIEQRAQSMRYTPERPLRIASIASGTAQELFEFLSSAQGARTPCEILLLDQDENAMAYARRRLERVLRSRPAASATRVTYLRETIKRLLTEPALLQGHGPFDIVICAGLFDYLKSSVAQTLIERFHASLAPDGTSYIGNMVPTNPARWIMEHHLDWFLIYRLPHELIEIARAAAPKAEVIVIEEQSGVNPLLAIRREPRPQHRHRAPSCRQPDNPPADAAHGV